MIIQVRGGSGAGKSWLVRDLLLLYGCDQVDDLIYKTTSGVYVLGRYDLTGPTPGKGGEAAGDGVMLEALLTRVADWGDVVFETSKALGRERIARLLQVTPVLWATLDTPAEERLARIYRRRELSGRNLGRPLNEDFHRRRGEADLRSAVSPPPGVESHVLNHQAALGGLLWLLARF